MKAKISKTFLFLAFACLGGFTVGLSGYTFIYGQGYSYLSDDPKACMNCHIMRDQYQSWNQSSHHNVATCNSCHTPENKVSKYLNKMDNGFMHSLKFTLGTYADPIRIREHNFNIAMNACLSCHGDLIDSTLHPAVNGEERQSCMQCHRAVGHSH